MLHIINEMSPYLLLGFLFAGLMHAYIPPRFYGRYLSRPSFRSVLNAALMGIPLPLCSCGVLPTAMTLRAEGASKGATASFLIATPQTGIDSIVATYGMLGLPFAVVRPIIALITALVGGAAVHLFSKETSEGDSTQCKTYAASGEPAHPRWLRALHYAFVEMPSNMGKWIVVGLVVAGMITVAVPDDAFTLFRDNSLASMLLVLVIAMPMYVCATGSIPIAVALMAKGLTPGAGLVLLMAGPACNVASMLIVRKVLGGRTLVVYIAAIVAGAVGAGLLVDNLHFSQAVNFMPTIQAGVMHAHCHVENDSWIAWLCSALLAALLLNVALRAYRQRSASDQQNTTNVTVYQVEGMACGHCRAAVAGAIRDLDGVDAVDVSLQKKEARVEGSVSEQAVIKAVESRGYRIKRKET